MGWEVDTRGQFSGRVLPFMELRRQIEMVWNDDADVELIAIQYSAFCADDALKSISWSDALAPLAPKTVDGHGRAYLELSFPVSAAFVRRVENWRKGRAVDLRFEVWLRPVWRPVRKLEVPGDESGGRAVRHTFALHAQPESTGVHFFLSIPRDVWLTLLPQLGYDAVDTFEVSVTSMKRHERFQKALQLLGEAQAAFLQGQWSTVVTDARRALEAAAATTRGDGKARFVALVEWLLPGEENEAKREVLSALMQALRDLRNESAHVRDLRAQIEREDAELALTVAISIFRFMGEAIQRAQVRTG